LKTVRIVNARRPCRAHSAIVLGTICEFDPYTMNGTVILIELAGHVGLLLWGTHMVGTGVQRGFGPVLRRWLGCNLDGRYRAFATGLGVTTLLQSSTATGLLATSFTATGVIALAPALAVMLGANVGTALLTQLLSVNMSLVGPPLVLAGVLAF
jgi:phosphate:Na+ symporter